MISLNEFAALKTVLEYISLEELLLAATAGFSEKDSVRDNENSDICSKAVESFLK